MPRRVTKDEAEIRQWASKRNAYPVQRAMITHDSEPAQLDFVFGKIPETGELQVLEWSQFFALFHLLGLVLAYDSDKEFELLRVDEQPSYSFDGKPIS